MQHTFSEIEHALCVFVSAQWTGQGQGAVGKDRLVGVPVVQPQRLRLSALRRTSQHLPSGHDITVDSTHCRAAGALVSIAAGELSARHHGRGSWRCMRMRQERRLPQL